MAFLSSCLVCLAMSVAGVFGHGKLIDPPMRSTVWRDSRFNTGTPRPVANYNDMELFCGGFGVQWTRNGGKCGTCGDPYDGERKNEAGGKYAQGIITGSYEKNGVLVAKVDLTAYHKGWFEFRLCAHNDVSTRVSQACLDNTVLQIVGNNTNRLYLNGLNIDRGTYEVHLQLPADVTCTQCVLQWLYNTGNSWGRDPTTGQGAVGLGPQEQFVNCADIEILDSGNPPPPPPPSSSSSSSSSSSTTTTARATTRTTRPTSRTSRRTTTTAARPTTTTASATTTTARATTTTSGSTDCTGRQLYCVAAAGPWAGNPGIATWCNNNCNHDPAYCPPSHCDCTC